MAGSLNIYIVEPNVFVAASLKRMLTELGYNVCGTAASFVQALDELQWVEAGLLITAINLEGSRNGIDLGKYIKTYLQLPVIYQSSVTDLHLIRAALANFPVAYLFKPVSKASLAEAIANFIDNPKKIPTTRHLSTICPL